MFNTKIIHKADRFDRIKYVARLLEEIPNSEAIPAKVPLWAGPPNRVAVRGNGLSVYGAVEAFLAPNLPLLVLEDDCQWIPDHWSAFLNQYENIPVDAGIIILGGDVDIYEDTLNYFKRVGGKYFGSHAVWFSPKLLETRFLYNAFRNMAELSLGTEPGDICVESLHLISLEGTGLFAYRPQCMAFTTHESHSDTFSRISPPRQIALTV
jgi:hypothetical protein